VHLLTSCLFVYQESCILRITIIITILFASKRWLPAHATCTNDVLGHVAPKILCEMLLLQAPSILRRRMASLTYDGPTTCTCRDPLDQQQLPGSLLIAASAEEDHADDASSDTFDVIADIKLPPELQLDQQQQKELASEAHSCHPTGGSSYVGVDKVPGRTR
jgi:hypothetical protein